MVGCAICGWVGYPGSEREDMLCVGQDIDVRRDMKRDGEEHGKKDHKCADHRDEVGHVAVS